MNSCGFIAAIARFPYSNLSFFIRAGTMSHVANSMVIVWRKPGGLLRIGVPIRRVGHDGLETC